MKVISVHSNKGGSGKTTLAISLAALFAEEEKKVCIIETDLSGAGLYASLELEMEPYEEQPDLNEYLLEVPSQTKKIDVQSLLWRYTDDENGIKFWVIKCSPDSDVKSQTLAVAERERSIGWMKYRLLDLTNEMKDEFDYCIFDCPPGIDGMSLASLAITLKWSGIPIFISTPDRSHIIGTFLELVDRETTNQSHKKISLLPERTFVVVNRVPLVCQEVYKTGESLIEAIVSNKVLNLKHRSSIASIQLPLYDFILEDDSLAKQFLLGSTGNVDLESIKRTNIPRIAKQIQDKLKEG